MGKKRCRAKYESKGVCGNIVAGTREVRQGRTGLEKEMLKIAAWKKGKNPWVSVPQGDNRPNYRVRANDYWGDPRNVYGIYSRRDQNG